MNECMNARRVVEKTVVGEHTICIHRQLIGFTVGVRTKGDYLWRTVFSGLHLADAMEEYKRTVEYYEKE